MARARENVNSHNTVRMRRGFKPGIAFFLTLLIVLYLAVLLWNYLTKKHISIYEVNTSEISDDSPLYAYALRNEEIITTDDEGYINYYIPEGSRVGKGDIVYTLDSDDSLRSVLDTIKSSSTDSADVSTIREYIETFYNTYDLAEHSQISDFHFQISNLLMEQSRSNLYKDLKKLLKSRSITTEYRKFKAPKSGVISYYTDGYESLKQNDIDDEIIAKSGTTDRIQVASDGKVTSGESAYKLVTSNEWSLIVPLDDDYYDTLKDLDTVRVTIAKDNISFNASVEHYDKKGTHFAKLTTSRYMERYINDRFLRIEFALRSAKGLKIPNSSILEKEYYEVPSEYCVSDNGKMTVIKRVFDEGGNEDVENIDLSSYYQEDDKYYVRDDRLSSGDVLLAGGSSTYELSKTITQEGVYSVNEGFCRFKPVEVLYQNKEYSIVSDTTRDGLSVFDHIVVDPSELNDDDFID